MRFGRGDYRKPTRRSQKETPPGRPSSTNLRKTNIHVKKKGSNNASRHKEKKHDAILRRHWTASAPDWTTQRTESCFCRLALQGSRVAGFVKVEFTSSRGSGTCRRPRSRVQSWELAITCRHNGSSSHLRLRFLPLANEIGHHFLAMNSVPCNFISSVVAFMSVQNWNFDALETLNSILWSRISKLQAGKVVRFESRLLFDVDTDSWRVVFYNSRQQTFNFDELTTFSRDIVFFEEVSIGYLEDDDDKTDAEHFREQKIDFFLLDLPDHHLNDTILWKFVDCDFSGCSKDN
ncbi:hypothetical protein QR680_012436 [Steinernema hermaphroditum]|uniref:Uncharacterized protein n=1 Tax=Steinernema hermaphroditum TaxID=289476 RepID=A0AA39I3Z7_9BILA|nr:hypothetical protein QR680_012436 [Steinernema hermaphroditum]